MERASIGCVATAVLLVALYAAVAGTRQQRAGPWVHLMQARRGLMAELAAERPPQGHADPDAAASARFDAVFGRYTTRHAAAVAILDGAAAPDEDPRKRATALADLRFVVAEVDSEGLGNRLPGLVTAFALALLIDRVFLIYDPHDRYYSAFTPTFDCRYNATRKAAVEGQPGFSVHKLGHVQRIKCREQSLLLLDDIAAKHADKTVIHYDCSDYELPLLAANEHYRRTLAGLAPHFATIGRPLLQPHPELRRQVRDVYAANVPSGHLVIGAQMRTMKRPDYRPPVQWYADVALAAGLKVAPAHRLRFFVASDSMNATSEFEIHAVEGAALDAMQAAIQGALARDWDIKQPVVFRSDARLDTRGAVVDMLLLGMCNETVITYGSSFGYVAAAWASRPPHFLQHLYQNYTYRDSESIGGRAKLPQERVADDHVFFWKAIIAEPCYWDAKSLLTGTLSGRNASLHDRMVAAFKSNANWMHYSQCQWNTERPCGDRQQCVV